MGSLSFEDLNSKLSLSTEIDEIVGESFENSNFEYQVTKGPVQSFTFISIALGCV